MDIIIHVYFESGYYKNNIMQYAVYKVPAFFSYYWLYE